MRRTRVRFGAVVGVIVLAAACASGSGGSGSGGGGSREAPVTLRSSGGGSCPRSNALSAEQIAEQRPAHIEEMLNQIPGVTVARVANGYSVQIRGTNGFSLNSEPLYLIDGMAVSGQRAGLLPVNPADVECVEVLKDVSLTGAFGTRGANGVILITTRRAN